MKYLLDTNICIYIIKQQPLSVINKFEGFDLGQICISSITVAELEYGVTKSSKPEQNTEALQKFLVPLEILDFDYNAASIYGKIRYFLEKKGTPIGAMDLLIASHAISKNITLVTNNEREFNRVPRIKVENWVKE